MDLQQKIFLRKTDAWTIVNTLISKVERADKLTICSFAVAEAFARKLLRERSKIKHLTLMLDFTIAKRHRSNLLFLEQVADEIYLCNTHAKLVLLESPDVSGVAVMSANATMNLRYECGFISYEKNLIDTVINDLNNMKQNAIRH
ncbi:MAG: hypothetical protein LBQ28_04625 [Prevotellaceae bacterium]|nr:hypothetical protein [Prevotellaceae bacterium]